MDGWFFYDALFHIQLESVPLEPYDDVWKRYALREEVKYYAEGHLSLFQQNASVDETWMSFLGSRGAGCQQADVSAIVLMLNFSDC